MHETLTRLGQIPLYRRLFGLFLFVGLLVAFRHLAFIGITWIVCVRALLALGGPIGLRLGKTERFGIGLCLGVFVLLLGLLGYGLVHVGTRYYAEFLALRSGRPLQDLLTELQTETLHRIPDWFHVEDLKDKVPALVTPAVAYLRATGRVLLHMLLGFILAVVYVLDRKPVDAMLADLSPTGVLGALRRYLSFLSEAVVITITLQVVVALVNTLLTLPILVALRLPHLLGFTLLLFFSSLVPVVGNLVSGVVLILAAYVYKGPVAVGVFLVSTFVLHKIEAYVLNPRLASRHVNLPPLILIVSLILFEHVFGLVGLFLSFPALYVALNIAADLRTAEGPTPASAQSPASASPPSPPSDPSPESPVPTPKAPEQPKSPRPKYPPPKKRR